MINIHKGRGFTFIELLVVIVIIGLLAVAIIVSLNSARVKARDAKRISDVKQMSKLLETQAAAGSTNLTGCFGAVANRDVRLCTGPGDISQFNSLGFQDPLKPTTICNNTASPAVCQYSITQLAGANRPTTNDYEICFYLENPVAGVPTGNLMKSIINGGEFKAGCNGT